MNAAREVLEADVLVEKGGISRIGRDLAPALPDLAPAERLDARGLTMIPGLVQTHIHLCQTLFRGLADDLSLIDWLRTRIWPFEGALSHETLRVSADLGLAELARGGTTTILDMGTVHHTDAVGEAVVHSGLRAWIGKAMMDEGDGVPPSLAETAEDSIRESLALAARWDGAAEGRIRYAFCPRFAFSCSRRLLGEVGEILSSGPWLLHTHANETVWEVEESARRWGTTNVGYLDGARLTGRRAVFAHGVHLADEERALLARTDTCVTHCPSSNLKLASGIADVPALWEAGVRVGLGADGAPANNSLDGFREMRLAALLAKPRRGPTAVPAERALALATIDGARVLGIEKETGSIEEGKAADLVLLDLGGPEHGAGGPAAARLGANVHSRIVYAASRDDVRYVFAAGELLVDRGRLLRYGREELGRRAGEALADIEKRL